MSVDVKTNLGIVTVHNSNTLRKEPLYIKREAKQKYVLYSAGDEIVAESAVPAAMAKLAIEAGCQRVIHDYDLGLPERGE